ncbi:putative Polyprotein [Cucumis melo var. makuwa]|uniref:Polyprotein n=1 Tax=Cucumis melo var. makuwa TaxID=1194695 RepID=A0A5A7T618_CUCMM|nr:putative Polyprotein [Cucumis melo var. makuwa]
MMEECLCFIRTSTTVACSEVVSPFDVHCRLDHPSLSVLRKLCPQFHNLSLANCDSCQFAKFHHLSSSPRVDKWANSPFELVHFDIWDVTLFEDKPFTTPLLSTSQGEEDDDLFLYTLMSPTPFLNLSPSIDPEASDELPIALVNVLALIVLHLVWRSAMIEEVNALDDNGTWDLVSLLAACRKEDYWVQTGVCN